jgi:hypothetical protein
MGHRIVVVLGSLALLGLGMAAGCMIVTGSTDGYAGADGGDAATPTVTSACAGDAAICLLNECTAASTCVARYGAGASCCAGVIGVSPAVAIGTACGEGACPLGTIPACEKDSDCEAGTCTPQSCSIDGYPASFYGCGVFPGCSIIVSPDAGVGDGGGQAKPDGGADAGSADAGDADIADANDASSSDAGDADIADANDSG